MEEPKTNNIPENIPQPKLDTSSIYPSPQEPTPPDTEQSLPPNKVPSSLAKKFIGKFLVLVMGVIGLGILGLIFGLLFPEAAAPKSTSGFQLIGTYIFVVRALPVMLVVFGIIAYATKKISFLTYPFIAYFLATLFYDTKIPQLVAGYLPATVSNESRLWLTLAIMFAFMTVHAFVKPLREIWQSRGLANPEKTESYYVNGSLLALVILTLILTISIASPLYLHQQRVRAAINIPDTDQFFGQPIANPINTTSVSYPIYYSEPTLQNDGTYQQSDSITTRSLSKWWERDIHTVCGDRVSYSYFPNQIATYEYKKTAKGFPYAEATFEANNSNPPKKSTAFHEYHYCFVIGYQKYDFQRDDTYGKAYLDKYSAADVISVIASSPSYLTLCTSSVKLYCNSSDQKRNQQFVQQTAGRYKQFNHNNTSTTVTGVQTPTINRSAYDEIGRLTIAEWGISFPLSEEIKDAYYTPSSSIKDSMTVGLRSLNTNECFAGVRKSPNIIGYGVAYLDRKKLTDIHPSPNTYIKGVIVGNYIYSMQGSGNIDKCLASAGSTTLTRTLLDDIFDWANAGVR